MNLELLIIEDTNLDVVLVGKVLCEISNNLQLPAVGIELKLLPCPRVTSETSFKSACDKVRTDVNEGGRIVIVDLALCASGFAISDAVTAHDAVLQPSLAVKGTTDEHKSGGYLVVYYALNNPCVRHLTLVASNQQAEDPMLSRMGTMRGSLNAKYDMLKGGLDNPLRLTSYLESAVKKWLAAFGAPSARLWPTYAASWFRESYCDVPHLWSAAKSAPDYKRQIVAYLSNVLLLGELEVEKRYLTLSESDKAKLHEYLKAFVGSSAALQSGSGYRLEWRHLPLLILACAPPPGAWPFRELLGKSKRSVFEKIKVASSNDRLFASLLVGDASGCVGLFQKLLVHDKNASLSTLLSWKVEDGSLVVKVSFDTTILKRQFEFSEKGHNVTDALLAVQDFAVQNCLRCEVNAIKKEVLIKCI